MKYIIIKNQQNEEHAIVFCDNVIHSSVARMHSVHDERIVSAGFFVYDQESGVATVYGRPEDSAIISRIFNKEYSMSRTNPKNLSIGDTIYTSFISDVYYDETGKREVHKIPARGKYKVVGSVIKYTGKYQEESNSYENYEPAHLKVDKGVRFYQCRENLTSPIVLVHHSDIIEKTNRTSAIFFKQTPVCLINHDINDLDLLEKYSEYGGWNISDLSLWRLETLNNDDL